MTANMTMLRLMIDPSRTFEIGNGTLTPSFQMGVRHDGGDAEEGLGLEAGGGLRFMVGEAWQEYERMKKK